MRALKKAKWKLRKRVMVHHSPDYALLIILIKLSCLFSLWCQTSVSPSLQDSEGSLFDSTMPDINSDDAALLSSVGCNSGASSSDAGNGMGNTANVLSFKTLD